MANNIKMFQAFSTDTSITQDDLDDHIEAAAVYDLNRDNMKSETRVVWAKTTEPTTTAQPTPLDGELWANLNSLLTSGGPQRRLGYYNVLSGVWLYLANAVYSTGQKAAAPVTGPSSSYEITGQLWYDMTLQMWRVYRDASFDSSAITGWHPVDTAYKLMKNNSGGPLSATDIVTRGTTAWGFTETAKEKDPSIVGVLMENTDDGLYGVVCTVEGGGRCNVKFDAGTYTIGIGDGLVQSSTQATARGVGALPTGTHISSAAIVTGVPYGCFASSEEVKTSGTGTIKCKMMGHVGTGARAYLTPASIRNYASTTAPAIYTSTDFSVLASGTAGAQGSSSSLLSPKHVPLIAAEIEISYFLGASGGGGDAQLQISLSKDGTNQSHQYLAFEQDVGANPLLKGRVNMGLQPTSVGTGSFDTSGNIAFFLSLPTSAGAYVTFQILMPSYIY